MSGPIGVSAVVRLRTPVRSHPAGTHALSIGQAPNSRHRYQAMAPGEPLPVSPLAIELEVAPGVTTAEWWRQSPWRPYAKPSVEDWEGLVLTTMA